MSINNINSNCRFCLRVLGYTEFTVGVTTRIADEFANITQQEARNKKKSEDNKTRSDEVAPFLHHLLEQPNLPKNLCIQCFDNIIHFCDFRKQLLNTQAILYQSTQPVENEFDLGSDDFTDVSQSLEVELTELKCGTPNSSNPSIDFEQEIKPNVKSKMQHANFTQLFSIYEKSLDPVAPPDVDQPPKVNRKWKPRNSSLVRPSQVRTPCKVCGKFLCPSYHRIHYRRAHLKEKPFECEICGLRSFNMDHTKCRFDIKNLLCDQCPNTFKTNRQLKLHISQMHSIERPFKDQLNGCCSSFNMKRQIKKPIGS